MNRKVELITFAAGKPCWKRAAARLEVQSHAFEEITSRHLISPMNLKEHIGDEFRDVLLMSEEVEKGFGLWSWKIPLISSKLDSMKDGSTLMFLDAGSTLNGSARGHARFLEYLDISESLGGLFFQQDFVESAWSKQLLRKDFPDDSAWQSGQLLGGIHFLNVSDENRELFRLLRHLAKENNYERLRDPSPVELHPSEFVAHRHDQSLISLGAKAAGLPYIPDETYFAPHWESRGEEFPIWATRLCSGNPDVSYRLTSRFRRELERRLWI
jgi:hypothetical protein